MPNAPGGDAPTIAAAARLLADRAVSPVELTRHCLDRIAASEGAVHAFHTVTEERALADARAAEARMMAGTRLGPLDGIPIAHKDNIATAGVRTTAHSPVLADWVPDRDAAVVERLAAAGTVLLGKLTCYEFALAGPETERLPFPPARNPWDLKRTTAGSSSGSGAAVAAGFVLGATGTDSGGSVRDPSALCGVTGIKPTYGRCSRRGLIPFSWSLDHAGPLAWTAEDCALLLQVMAGHDPEDVTSSRLPVPDYAAGLVDHVRGESLRGVRIGVVRHWHEEETPVSRETLHRLNDAVAIYRQLGAEVRDATLPAMAEYHACGWVIALAEVYAAHETRVRSDGGAGLGRLVREGFALGGAIPAGAYLQAMRRRRALCRETAAAMQGLDLLLTAVQDDEAPLTAKQTNSFPFEKPNFSMPFDVTGQPAMSVCTGFGGSGMPLAMQLIARPFEEGLLLRAAHAYQAETPWRDRRPAAAAEAPPSLLRRAARAVADKL